MTGCLALTALLLAAGTSAESDRGANWAMAVFPSGAQFDVEIAADPESRQRGYMFREHVGPDEGMLFLFEGPGRHSIWMKNCRVPLDIIWLDASWGVVEIAHERPPCPKRGECPSIAPLRMATYVLEVAGGVARQHGLEIGDRIEIVAEPALGP